jgi:diguanylate cyclase (GGDEF)-like protein
MAKGQFEDETHPTPKSLLVEAGAPRRPCLVMIAGPLLGEIFVVPTEAEEAGGLLIGRDPEAQLRLAEDESVSRRHARVVRTPEGGARILDLESQNGTWVDGERVTDAVLREGQKVRVGQTVVLKFAMYDAIEERYQRELLEAALRDGLTRAFNRRYFAQRLAAELRFAERHRSTVALLLIDADHFKAVNDEHGHQRGDEVLRGLAELVGEALRAEDVLARWGGEELAVLVRGIPVAGAMQLAERLRQRVEEKDFGLGKPLTVSVGVAAWPPPDAAPEAPLARPEADKLVAEADAALYRAKQAGRNRVSR